MKGKKKSKIFERKNKIITKKRKRLPRLIPNCHRLTRLYNHYLYYYFPFHYVPEKFQKKVWLSPSNPHHLPRLSTLTSYRITSWSHSEANRGDKISLTRNGPIFQYPRHGTGTEPSYVVPEPPPFSIISPLRRLEGRNFCGSFGRFRQCSAMLLLRSTAANNIVVGRVAEWVAWAR